MKDMWIRNDRMVNVDVIRSWIHRVRSETGKDGLAVLSLESEVSVSSIQRVMTGQVPGAKTRMKLCSFFDKSLDELFPLKDDLKKAG